MKEGLPKLNTNTPEKKSIGGGVLVNKRPKNGHFIGLLTLCIVTILGAVSYAFFSVYIEDEGDVNSLKGKALFNDYKISLSETNTGLSLENTYPMPDEVGLRQSPYTFTVKNEEKSRGVGISIIVEVISTSTLSDDLVHVAIEDEVRSLSSENTVTPSEATYKSAYTIYDFDLAPGSSKTYNLRAWINSSGTVDNAQNKTWSARVLVIPNSLSEKTLRALNLTSKGVLTTGFDNPASTMADTGIYELADEGDMTSYYFRGPVENNYVRFGKWRDDEPDVYVGHRYDGMLKDFATLSACQTDTNGYNKNCTLLKRAGKDMYWRIIRINGDGSLRMIYAGTSTHANDNQGDDTFIGASVFNKNGDDAKDVGYMYGPIGATASTSKEEAQMNVTSSTIKDVLESWYAKNLMIGYDRYISKDAIFCNDRSTPGKDITGNSSDTGLGYGTNLTAYGAAARIGVWNSATTASNPTFKCPQENDKFTSKNSTVEIGNTRLEYPVGLITADEILAAGSGKHNTESDYYLKRNLSYWSESPAFNNTVSLIYIVKNDGKLDMNNSNSINAVVPVVNLTAEYARSLTQGDGTAGNPYRA